MLFIASKQNLGYQKYKRNFLTQEVNSFRKKSLSSLYFDECFDWVGPAREHILSDGQSLNIEGE